MSFPRIRKIDSNLLVHCLEKLWASSVRSVENNEWNMKCGKTIETYYMDLLYQDTGLLIHQPAELKTAWRISVVLESPPISDRGRNELS